MSGVSVSGTDERVTSLRPARRSVAIFFLVNSVLMWSWIVRIPDVKDNLGLTERQLGFALLGNACGAMLMMAFAGQLIDRFGSARVTRLSSLALCIVLPLPTFAFDAGSLFVALLCVGMMLGLMDVAMNANGVAVEGRYGRAILSSFHGVWSVGALGSSALGAVIAGAGLSARVHLTGMAVVMLPLVLLSSRFLLDERTIRSNVRPPRIRPNRRVLGLGAIAFCVMFGEGSIANWAGVFLRETVETDTGIAASGYVVFQLFMAGARLSGDWVGVRLGRVTIVRVGGLLAAAGTLIVVIPQTLISTYIGLAILGVALAGIVPVAFGAAGALQDVPAGAAISMVATIGYSASLVGPPLIGIVADATSLPIALSVVAVLSLAVSALSPLVDVPRSVMDDDEPEADIGAAPA